MYRRSAPLEHAAHQAALCRLSERIRVEAPVHPPMQLSSHPCCRTWALNREAGAAAASLNRVPLTHPAPHSIRGLTATLHFVELGVVGWLAGNPAGDDKQHHATQSRHMTSVTAGKQRHMK
mmetsp:Transcript_37735/g.95430  ORF Transcript_37735/g.95430 Transcript_37735/m.95430 type:complete len:121 (+) Transcript_37735:619-981(+)